MCYHKFSRCLSCYYSILDQVVDLAAEHQQAVSLGQWDDSTVAKIKSAVDESFHVWSDGLDVVTKEAADQMIFRKNWLKHHFWLPANGIIWPSVETSESPVTPYQMYPRRAGDDLLAAPSPMKTSRSYSLE